MGKLNLHFFKLEYNKIFTYPKNIEIDFLYHKNTEIAVYSAENHEFILNLEENFKKYLIIFN